MLFKKSDPASPPPRTPPWFKWLVLGFFAYALVVNVTRNKEDMPDQAGETVTQNATSPGAEESKTGAQALGETVRDSIDLPGFLKKAFPTFRGLPIRREDIKEGTGPAALCGQQAEVRYTARLADGTEFDSNIKDAEPLRFTIGARKANRVLEEGVEGMRAGAVRRLTVQAEYGIDREKFPSLSVPKNSHVTYEAELLSLAPEVPEEGMHPRFMDMRGGEGEPARCGDTVKLNLVVWNSDGTKGFSTENREPLTLTLGNGKEPAGLENGVIGMRPGGLRTLILPPAYQTALDKASVNAVTFSAGGVAVVDVERLERLPDKLPEPQQ